MSRLRAALVVVCICSKAAAADPVDGWLTENLDGLVTLYRELHQAPELSYAEARTAQRLGDELASLGIAVTRNVGGHGVVGVLENGQGPRLLLRADMDALPVTEETDLVYRSQAKSTDALGQPVGVMHACGHDIHMTNLIGAARFLAAHRDQWQGTIVFVCQPAEERGGGAKAMLADGLYERFGKPDFALALHVDSALAADKIGYRAGPILANVDSVDVTFRGRGGHGAYPHTTIDPVLMAAHFIVDLQSIVSREISPTDPAVITVGSIHGGSKHNIIGNECHLQITVRSFNDAVRAHLLSAIERKAKAVAAGARAPEPTIGVSEGTPALSNDAALVERVVPLLRQAVGVSNVVASEPSMGGEDFSQFGLAGAPVFMYRLGTIEPKRLERMQQLGQEPPSLHSSTFYPDPEPTLTTGVRATLGAVLGLLPRTGQGKAGS
jgi:hippurate hydrolase